MDLDQPSTNSEDTLIFIALHPKITKMKRILKHLKNFMEAKQSTDPTDRFNIIAFEEMGPIYYEDFVYDQEHILAAAEEIAPSLSRPNIMGGIMVAITFIIDVFKQVSEKTFRLIVLMDKTTPPLEHQDLVLDLVNQVKDMPFFIDFVRIDIDNPGGDLELIRFVKRCNGEVFFAEDDGRGLAKVMEELAKKKEVARDFFGKRKVKLINPENLPFYENLADALHYVDEDELESKICHICQEKGELVKCPICEAPSHAACLAMWAENSNIGVEHLFRCDQCFNLLKIPKDFMMQVKAEGFSKIHQQQVEYNPQAQYELLKEKEARSAPGLKTTADPLGGMGGQDDWGVVEETGWGDDEAEGFDFEKDEDLQIQWCSECGKMLPPEVKFCSSCGAKL